MKTGRATGLQIAFFTFAVLLLAVPISNHLANQVATSPDGRAIVKSVAHFALAALIVFGFPGLRARAIAMLGAAIPREKKAEVAAVAALKGLFFAVAIAGGMALWYWVAGGPERLSQRVALQATEAKELANAFSPVGLFRQLVVASLVAPVLEELVFRGFLYRAWEERWGWIPAMLLTSAVFGIYHPQFLGAFFSSVIFVALYRRTGSLRAPILAHAAYNFLLWYPFLGGFVFPTSPEARSELSAWWLQLAAFGFAAAAVPWYVWMARRAYGTAAIRPE